MRAKGDLSKNSLHIPVEQGISDTAVDTQSQGDFGFPFGKKIQVLRHIARSNNGSSCFAPLTVR